uniref:hypothetical protein n=1 Tax=Ornithobacterium rhinotracheale TaxID=28251 RepID=UPI0039A4CC25
MEPKKCKISKGTKLVELADLFELKPEELRRYHNTYCPLSDLIEEDIPSHVRIIFIPPDNQTKSIFFNPETKKIKYDTENKLSRINYSKRFGVMQKYYHNEKLTLQIHYEIEITLQNNIVYLNRGQVYVDQQSIDYTYEQVADKIGSFIYPLKLKVGDSGEIEGVLNLDEIAKRWHTQRSKLADYYVGKEVEVIFNKTDRLFRNAQKLKEGLKKSWFYKLYFLPMYAKLNDDKEITLELPIHSKGLIKYYKPILKIDESISKTHLFAINVKGENIDFLYKLDAKDNSIFSIQGQIDSLEDDNKKIIFECYSLLSN